MEVIRTQLVPECRDVGGRALLLVGEEVVQDGIMDPVLRLDANGVIVHGCESCFVEERFMRFVQPPQLGLILEVVMVEVLLGNGAKNKQSFYSIIIISQ